MGAGVKRRKSQFLEPKEGAVEQSMDSVGEGKGGKICSGNICAAAALWEVVVGPPELGGNSSGDPVWMCPDQNCKSGNKHSSVVLQIL